MTTTKKPGWNKTENKIKKSRRSTNTACGTSLTLSAPAVLKRSSSWRQLFFWLWLRWWWSVALRPQKPWAYWGREPRTSASTFTQLLSSDSLWLETYSPKYSLMPLNALCCRCCIFGCCCCWWWWWWWWCCCCCCCWICYHSAVMVVVVVVVMLLLLFSLLSQCVGGGGGGGDVDVVQFVITVR